MGGMSLATAQAAAAAAAAFMQQAQQQPGGTGCATTAPHGTAGATGTGAGTVTKWWHDPQLTFGPPVDTEMLARWPVGGPAALLAREGPEVQSAPAGQLKRPADSRRRSSMPYSDGPRMRLKRKATADADEASSGTTGHTHEPDGGAGTTAGGPFKVRWIWKGGRACRLVPGWLLCLGGSGWCKPAAARPPKAPQLRQLARMYTPSHRAALQPGRWYSTAPLPPLLTCRGTSRCAPAAHAPARRAPQPPAATQWAAAARTRTLPSCCWPLASSELGQAAAGVRSAAQRSAQAKLGASRQLVKHSPW